MFSIKKVMLLLISIIAISLVYIAISYSRASITNGTTLSIVDEDKALVAVPKDQEIGTDNRITILNNSKETLKIYIPEVTIDDITISGDELFIEPSSPSDSLNYPVNISAPEGTDRHIEITIIAESLSGDFKAQIKSNIIIKNSFIQE